MGSNRIVDDVSTSTANHGPLPIVTQTNLEAVESTTDHSHSPTSLTSPASSIESCLTPTSAKDLKRKRSKDTDQEKLISLYEDASNYVAVGYIFLPSGFNSAPETEAWCPVTHSLLMSCPQIAHNQTLKSLQILLEALWVKLYCRSSAHFDVLRVHILPDDVGRSYVDRSKRHARIALKQIMSAVENRRTDPHTGLPVDRMESPEENCPDHESLFYIFNTLESPSPDPEKVKDTDNCVAVTDILEASDAVAGLKTPLYPFQRRSAAMMIQRECNPAFMLDPRFETRLSITGDQYYYDAETGILLRDKILYEETRGGILAETMGFGKTLICLAVILVTRGHWPRIPPEYSVNGFTRPRTGSLLDMTAANIGAKSIAWKPRLEQLSREGDHYERCIEACERNFGSYSIPPPPARYSGRDSRPRPAAHLRLCPTTLVIVPPNLLGQWRRQIASHTEGLKVLEIGQTKDGIPPADELIKYDIVLMSKARFEKESSEITYHQSPLTDLHWLRIIVDEGHSFALSGHRTNAIHVLDRLHVERRWIVSGTPTQSLMGVEVGLAAAETTNDIAKSSEGGFNSALNARKKGAHSQTEMQDLDKLRVIVQDFLKLKPWANSSLNDSASWSTYIMPYDKHGNKRKSTASLRNTLNGLVVRHRIEDVEKDLSLPPLHNRVVYLQPSLYDKMSINVFIMVLISNAITSERTDQDYMFHPRNKKNLNMLINNLRQSGFWWVGFDTGDLKETVRISKSYLENKAENVSPSDRLLLTKTFEFGEFVLSHLTWKAFILFQEMGIFVDDFPDFARDAWSMSSSPTDPLLLGTKEAEKVQKRVNAQLAEQLDPTEGLAGAGLRAMQEAKKRAAGGKDDRNADNVPSMPALPGGRDVKMRKRTSPKSSKLTPLMTGGTDADMLVVPYPTKPTLSMAIPSSSPVSKTRIRGTASSKLTYLIDCVLKYQDEEKIIIFYDGNNIAYWIAEALDLFGVEFLIYSNTLKTAQRATYLNTFNHSESFRVLIMDLRQAAHGLHIACASRVFIVNPIWQPSIEAQAIKRAHRIGQTRPVHVETLVLKDTLEDKMLRRRKNMSNQELENAEKSLLDDKTMSSIIQNESLIEISDEEKSAYGQIAMLEKPQPLFGSGVERRKDQSSYSNADENMLLREINYDDDEGDKSFSTPTPKMKRKATFGNELKEDDGDNDSSGDDRDIPRLTSDVITSSASAGPRKKKARLKFNVRSVSFNVPN